jgi:DNA (cytosine-5)-methyltransferase 1
VKGSLCTGTGALDLVTPGEPAWVAETDPDASLVLKREHPEAENLGDITTLLQRTTTTVTELSSGDPCQSMSLAGQRRARADVRFLWPYVNEIIQEMRPQTVFLENVQGLVSLERGALLQLRLDDLRAAGYAVRWTVLGACAVGAPHHRHRWFARAEHVGPGAPEAERVVMKCGAPRSGGRALLPTSTTADGKGGPGASGRDGGLNLRTAVQPLPTPRARDHKGSEGPNRELAGRHAGDALPTVVAMLPTPRATDIGTSGRRSSEGWRPQLGQAVMAMLPTPRATDGVNGGPSQRGRRGDLAMGSAVQEQHWGKFAAAVQLWEEITGVLAPSPTEPAPKGGVRLNAELSEWMMGMRRGLVTDGFARNSALKMAGNGVVTLQAKAAHDLLAPR